MNTTITNEPHEILEIRPPYNGFNDVGVSLVKKRRARVVDDWTTEITVLNRREALAVHKAIEDAFLAPPQRYSARRG